MRTVGLTAAVFLLAFSRSLADGFGLSDESWFLQVAARVRAGDTLYRDVFLGTTPLSLYVTTALTYATGVEIVAVKIVTNTCFAMTTVLAGRLSRQAGLSGRASWLVMGALVIWGRPYGNPPYTPMAMLCFVAALSAALAARDRAGRARVWCWFGAGALAGLSLAAKQNIGLLALAALGAALLLDRSERGDADSARSRFGAAMGGAAIVLVATLLPVALSGGLPKLWEYGFAAKGAYVNVGAVSYAASVADWLNGVRQPYTSAGVASAVHGFVLVLPATVLIAFVWSARRLDRRHGLLGIFACAALLTAFPRWDRFHMAYALPVHLVALGSVLPYLGVRVPHRAVRGLIPAVVLAAVVVTALPAATRAFSGAYQPSTLPHFRGPLIRPDDGARLADAAGRLRQAAHGQTTMVLGADAGFWYLASGVSNPTPFDIPAVTSVGSSGVTWLLARLAAGDITQVCVGAARRDRLALEEVAGWVRANFDGGPDVGPCTIFRTR